MAPISTLHLHDPLDSLISRIKGMDKEKSSCGHCCPQIVSLGFSKEKVRILYFIFHFQNSGSKNLPRSLSDIQKCFILLPTSISLERKTGVGTFKYTSTTTENHKNDETLCIMILK